MFNVRKDQALYNFSLKIQLSQNFVSNNIDTMLAEHPHLLLLPLLGSNKSAS